MDRGIIQETFQIDLFVRIIINHLLVLSHRFNPLYLRLEVNSSLKISNYQISPKIKQTHGHSHQNLYESNLFHYTSDDCYRDTQTKLVKSTKEVIKCNVMMDDIKESLKVSLDFV